MLYWPLTTYLPDTATDLDRDPQQTLTVQRSLTALTQGTWFRAEPHLHPARWRSQTAPGTVVEQWLS